MGLYINVTYLKYSCDRVRGARERQEERLCEMVREEGRKGGRETKMERAACFIILYSKRDLEIRDYVRVYCVCVCVYDVDIAP